MSLTSLFPIFAAMAEILDPHKDPFGQAALDFYQGAQHAEIQVYSDLAVEDSIPVSYLFRNYQAMPTWEQTALDACMGRVLDIGAGVGSHSLWLQSMGHEVVSLDMSPGLIEVMEKRGIQQPAHVDFWEFPPDSFDTILLMMNGIGLVGDLKGLNRFLQMLSQWLASGGQVLLDSSDVRYLYEEGDIHYPLPSQQYYGVIRYQMSYKHAQSDPFDWLYIDYDRLQKHAHLYGYEAERLIEGEHFEYLARLTKLAF